MSDDGSHLDESSELDSMVEITFTRGGFAYLALHEYDRVDAEWRAYIDGGKRCDKVIVADGYAGSEFSFLLSDMRHLDRNTREVRRQIRLRDAAFKREKHADVGVDFDKDD